LDAAASDALLADVEAAADSDETGGDQSAGELVEGLDLDAAASDALLADVEAAADSDETGGDQSAAEDTGGG
jgi:hypothetical protein